MSESPEEQPSTGVLGRIGSWFSPWRGKGPKSPTEDESPTTDEALTSEGVEESEEPLRPQVGDQHCEGEKEQSAKPNSLDFSRDSFLCEEEAATQSAHRHDSAVSSTDIGEGGSKEEEFGCREKRTGQGEGREESGNGTSVSGNLEKNASHLTHHSSSSEQGADQAHAQLQAQRQAQVQTGKRLHVYLEETSVIHRGKDSCVGQEVVRTKVTESLQALTKTKSSPSVDSAKTLTSTSADSRKTNVKHIVGEQSYYTALVGVSLNKESQSVPEPDKEQTVTDDMGRKNAARRKYRKNSQGDRGDSTQEKVLPSEQLVSEGFPPSDNSKTSPEGKSPETHMDDSAENSSPKHNLTSQASPMGGENKTSCSDMDKQLANLQDSNADTALTLACAVDEGADMEGDDSLYRVERKTETPESKRRSIKVSRSEVKFFSKYVPLNSGPKTVGDDQDFKSPLRNAKEEEKTKPKTEIGARLPNVKRSNEEPKSGIGRIADKIGLFENQRLVGINKESFHTTRSADVSPVRKVTERLKADYDLPVQRSRSAERQSPARSRPVVGEKPMTIKDRIRNFTEASQSEAKTALSQKPATTGMPQKTTSSVTVAPSDLKELDSQGKLDAEELRKTKDMLRNALKQERQDTTSVSVDVSISKQQSLTSKTEDPDTKSESAVSAQGTGDSSELTSNISPQSKGPNRTGSRSKRRKSREPASPTSPNNENKATTKPEVTAIKHDQVDDTVVTVSASKQPTAKVSISSDKGAGKQTDTKPKHSQEEMEVSEKQRKLIDPSKNIDKSISRKDELPEPSVDRDEPDTSSHNRETKTAIDKKSVSLAQMEEKSGGRRLVLTQERQKTLKDSRGHSDSSPSATPEQPLEKSSSEQESPVETPKIHKDSSVQPEKRSTEKVKQPSPKDVKLQTPKKDTGLVTSESKYVGKKEKTGSEEKNQSEKKEKEKPQQLPHPDKNTANSTVSKSEEGKVEIKPSVAKPEKTNLPGKKEESASIKDLKTAKDTGSSVDLPEQVSQKTSTMRPEKAAAPAVSHSDDAVSQAESDEGPLTRGTAAEVTPELKTKPAEICKTETEHVAISAVPQSNSVSVEKMENSPDDSHTHGANGVGLSGSRPITRATAAVGEESVKAVNDSPVLITVQADSVAEKALSVKEASPISISKSTCSEGAEQDDGKNSSTVKSVPSEGKVSGDAKELVSSRSHGTATEQMPAQCPVSKVTGKTFSLLSNELPSLPNGDVMSQSRLLTVRKKELDNNNKPSQTPKAPASPAANKQSPESPKRSPLKKLHLPQGLSIEDSFRQQDAPSSWLDVDFPKRKLKVPEAKLTSSGSESNLLDTSNELDDDNFVERIKKLCAPFSLPPRKHNHFRPPQPPFAMPAIKEDRFEKTFDPGEFKFGLRKKKQFGLETSPSVLAKLQTTETKSGLKKPARASLADRSLLLSSLDPDSWLRENNIIQDVVDAKEEKDDKVKVKSRLEGSCVLSSLTSSLRGKKNGAQIETDVTSSGEDSPTRTLQQSPPPLTQPPPPSPTAPPPINDTLALGGREEAQPAGAGVSDSGPSLPSFSDFKLPDYLEKYLHREPAKPVQSTQAEEKVNTKATDNMTTKGEVDRAVKAAPGLPDAVPPCFPVIPPHTPSSLPDQPVSLPTQTTANHMRTPKGLHRRPGKMVLFEKAEFSGQAYEIYRDVADATSLQLSPLISVKVVRGCWVLYEKPGFQGRSIALEEGGMELTNMWAETHLETEPHNIPPMQIGSIRLAVWDYSLSHIDLFAETEGHGRVSSFHDDTIETGSFGIPLSAASIQVHSGVWLVFSDPGFQGMLAVLETGVYPFPETWGFTSPFVGSLRPLKMGGFKVENPSEVKAVVYEKPGFEGSFLEIDSDVFSFCEGEEDSPTESVNLDTVEVKAVGSLKITGGLWVGYSQPGFEGQQHILEEGEYLDCSEWGGSEQLLSMRPILADFMSPHLKMFSEEDFGKLGVNVDLTVPVINMDDTGYGTKTQSIDVISGVWIVFEEPGFCGESYLLEKGLYGSPEDWGALQPRVASVMPVMLDDFENAAKFKVQLFSDSSLQGPVLTLEDSVASLPATFSVASCKVIAGSWLAFEGQDFTGRMYVLEVGSYPDLRAMGCDNGSASITSLQPVGFEFSLPSITLFERCSLRGKRVVLTDGSVNLQLAGGCSRVQSVLVEGGMWVLYEGINYLGAQIFLKPGEIPDWRQFSSWNRIGSLRPLLQKQVHFRVRNRQSGLIMTVTGDLDDVKLLRIQETEETHGFEQIWFYRNGYLHCKLLEECCLCPGSSVTIAGGRAGLTPQADQHVHLWSITPEGFIRYTPSADLVLDVKGGRHFDKNQIILNSLNPTKPQQRWDVEVL